jgi:hypothetical protein
VSETVAASIVDAVQVGYLGDSPDNAGCNRFEKGIAGGLIACYNPRQALVYDQSAGLRFRAMGAGGMDSAD